MLYQELPRYACINQNNNHIICDAKHLESYGIKNPLFGIGFFLINNVLKCGFKPQVNRKMIYLWRGG